MTWEKPTKPRWADGSPDYVAEPSEAVKTAGWKWKQKPPFQWMNWLFRQGKRWLDFTEKHLTRIESLTMTSSSGTTTGNYPLYWDPDNDQITFTQWITVMFQQATDIGAGGGLQRNSIDPADSPITLEMDEVVVAILKEDTDQLTQVAYASLVPGTYAVVSRYDLEDNPDYHETVLFRRRHDDILEIPPMKQNIFDDGATPVEFELGGRIDPGGGGMSNPMTTQGDMIYGGSSGAPTRLAKGTAAQVLKMNAGATAPEWGDAGGGGASRWRIENVGFGDTGTEPDIGAYTLSISSENYYVPTIDMGQDEQVTFKTNIPENYQAGEQIYIRLTFASAGTSVGYTFNNFVGLLDDGDVIDTSIPVETQSAVTVTSGASANEKTVDVALKLTDASGQIGGVAVAPGDAVTVKIERTDSDANDFRLITVECGW